MKKSPRLQLTSSFTLMAILGSLALVGAQPAAARNILSCEGPSRQSVVECCERQVLRHGLPMWMLQTGSNCRRMATRCFTVQTGTSYASLKTVCVAVRSEDGGGKDKHRRQHDGGKYNNNNNGRPGGNNQPSHDSQR
jgi:hypothetical protein